MVPSGRVIEHKDLARKGTAGLLERGLALIVIHDQKIGMARCHRAQRLRLMIRIAQHVHLESASC